MSRSADQRKALVIRYYTQRQRNDSLNTNFDQNTLMAVLSITICSKIIHCVCSVAKKSLTYVTVVYIAYETYDFQAKSILKAIVAGFLGRNTCYGCRYFFACMRMYWCAERAESYGLNVKWRLLFDLIFRDKCKINEYNSHFRFECTYNYKRSTKDRFSQRVRLLNAHSHNFWTHHSMYYYWTVVQCLC